jgi:hypothetical protein
MMHCILKRHLYIVCFDRLWLWDLRFIQIWCDADDARFIFSQKSQLVGHFALTRLRHHYTSFNGASLHATSPTFSRLVSITTSVTPTKSIHRTKSRRMLYSAWSMPFDLARLIFKKAIMRRIAIQQWYFQSHQEISVNLFNTTFMKIDTISFCIILPWHFHWINRWHFISWLWYRPLSSIPQIINGIIYFALRGHWKDKQGRSTIVLIAFSQSPCLFVFHVALTIYLAARQNSIVYST